MAERNKNVILIVVDALRARSIGSYGKDPSFSPTIDRLGKEGALFENTYTTTVTTDPTITAIMTGRHPISNSFINNETKITRKELDNIKKIPLIAERLKENGYYTGAIDWLSRWFERGFDYYSGGIVSGEKQKEQATKLDKIYKYMRIIDLATLHLVKRDFLNRIYYLLKYEKLPYDPANVVINDAIDFVDKNKNRNFFLYVHLWDTHYPYSRPKTAKSVLLDSIQDRYLECINFVDGEIKKLLLFLENKKLLDKTLVVLTGDHGESLTEHSIYISHRGLYEETVKVPLIFKGPGIPSVKMDGLVQNIDIVPTILNYLNIDYNENEFDGNTLISLLTKKRKNKKLVYFEDLTYGEYKIRKDVRLRGIRKGKYKYIQSLRGEKKFLFDIYPKIDELILEEELYDLEKDPCEKNNLAKYQKKLKNTL